MHARVISTTRLAARYAQTGLQSRVHASKVINSQQKVQFQSRLFNSARTLFDASKEGGSPAATATNPEAETTAFTASSSLPESSSSFPVTEPTSSTTSADAAQEPAAAATPTPATAPKLEDDKADVTKRTVFVGGLSWNVDNQWLEDEVLKALDLESGVDSVRIARNHLGKSKGFAFVELSSPELVQQLAGLRLSIDGRDVEFVPSTSGPSKPRSSSPRDTSRQSGPRNPPNSTLWVGNVAWSASRESLEDAFSRFGDIQRVHQPTDRETGRSRGIAYIEFGSVEEAQSAYTEATEQGIELEGRAVRVDYAEDKQSFGSSGRSERGDYKPRGGGGGRGGGRGGFGGRGGGRGGGGGGREGGNRRQRDFVNGGDQW
ncbi:hypothetical protein JCM5353_000024 [Sporobolomyces roseus]